MVLKDRNQTIRDLRRKHPNLTLEEIGDIYHISRQRVCDIVNTPDNCGIMASVENTVKLDPNTPISATQAAKTAKIPYYIIADWVRRGLVNIHSRPDRKACTGSPVLLDPVSLQERIDRYRPRQKNQAT